MVISSLVIETVGDSAQAAADALSKIEGTEVHEINGSKIVVTIEAETLDESHAIASEFIAIDGVSGINVIYVNFEDDPTLHIPNKSE